VECTDQPASIFCEQCHDDFCDVCYQAQHKRGMRAKHNATKIATPLVAPGASAVSSSSSSAAAKPGVDKTVTLLVCFLLHSFMSLHVSHPFPYQQMDVDAVPSATPSASPPPLDADEAPPAAPSIPRGPAAAAAAAAAVSRSRGDDETLLPSEHTPLTDKSVHDPDWFLERAQYIPLRLTLEERKFLRLLESTLNVSEYTDKVDIISYKDKRKRIYEQLKDVCAILSGLVVASDYNLGQKMIKDSEFKDNEQFFKDVFELGRRHKVRNPGAGPIMKFVCFRITTHSYRHHFYLQRKCEAPMASSCICSKTRYDLKFRSCSSSLVTARCARCMNSSIPETLWRCCEIQS
jgi:hypothetical protein